MKNENYDPMREFWRMFMPFLFKQTPLIVFMSFSIAVIWMKMGQMESQARIDRLQIRRECSEEISDIRRELFSCKNENDTLRRENDTLRRENADIHRRLLRIESRINTK